MQSNNMWQSHVNSSHRHTDIIQLLHPHLYQSCRYHKIAIDCPPSINGWTNFIQLNVVQTEISASAPCHQQCCLSIHSLLPATGLTKADDLQIQYNFWQRWTSVHLSAQSVTALYVLPDWLQQCLAYLVLKPWSMPLSAMCLFIPDSYEFLAQCVQCTMMVPVYL